MSLKICLGDSLGESITAIFVQKLKFFHLMLLALSMDC